MKKLLLVPLWTIAILVVLIINFIAWAIGSEYFTLEEIFSDIKKYINVDFK
jgi:hypothetical protein